MASARCARPIESAARGRARRELDADFEVVEETIDKADSATMWWRGVARCRGCGQRVAFDCEDGPGLAEGRVVSLP